MRVSELSPILFVEEFICAEPCRHQGVRLCFFYYWLCNLSFLLSRFRT